MKVLFISLGCDKNTVDSEVMMGYLSEHGYSLTDDECEADAIIVNTCTFIHDAKEESIQTLLEMAEYKEKGKCKALIAAGCLAQRYHQEMLEEIPEVDGIIGTTAYDAIIKVLDETLGGNKTTEIRDIDYLPRDNAKRILTTGGVVGYLKVAEGCSKHCTYCIIPQVRGRYRSVPMEKLMEDAIHLAKNGVKELIIVAQEVTIYGQDIYGENRLCHLLDELCKIDGITWIRLLYCYPEEMTPQLIDTIKRQDKICKYIDMPIQHCEDRILSRMGRKTTKADIKRIVNMLRKEIPNMAIRTTLITGFPGETDQDHNKLLDFVNEMEFDRLGVFTYSQEDNTPAAEMDHQMSEEIKAQRKEQIMTLQQEIAFDKAKGMIGTELKVLIEGHLAGDNVYVGRTSIDAPNVDGYIFIESEEELYSGDFVMARVTGAREYDLVGEII